MEAEFHDSWREQHISLTIQQIWIPCDIPIEQICGGKDSGRIEDRPPALQDSPFLKPALNERRPHRQWMILVSEAEGVPAPGKEVNFSRNSRIA